MPNVSSCVQHWAGGEVAVTLEAEKEMPMFCNYFFTADSNPKNVGNKESKIELKSLFMFPTC